MDIKQNRTMEEHLKRLEEKLDRLNAKLSESPTLINDWIDEATVKRITGLGKSTLYNLRKEGKLTSSRFSKRKVYYRSSDLSHLLDINEKELA